MRGGCKMLRLGTYSAIEILKYILSPLSKFSGFKDLNGVSVFHVEFINHLWKGDGWQC